MQNNATQWIKHTGLKPVVTFYLKRVKPEEESQKSLWSDQAAPERREKNSIIDKEEMNSKQKGYVKKRNNADKKERKEKCEKCEGTNARNKMQKIS